MSNLLACGLVVVLAAVSFAAPNPAINRIDAHDHKPYSTTIVSSETAFSSSTAPHITLKPREPAVKRIDAVGVNVHHTTTSTSARSSSSLTLIRTTLEAHIAINPRDPAVNRIDAVGNGMVDQALFDVAGGTPVTLAVSDVQQLEAAATETIGAVAVSMPAISVNPSPDNTAVPASFFAGPTPSSSAIPFKVPDTQTVIYITLHPELPLPKIDMGQVLVHAMLDLREIIKLNGKDGWLPKDDWSYFEAEWNCLLTADRNLIPAPDGREQHLTYGILHSALVGLWGAMYSQGRYFACDFEIQDAQWGVVGSGRMAPWEPVAGNLTTS